MAPRAVWRGFLQVAGLSCPMALFTAVSTSDHIAFTMINRATGHRARREFVDSQSGEVVAKDDQVRGYQTEKDRYVVLEPEEIASAAQKGDKTIAVSAFLALDDVDQVFFDKPYYLAPSAGGAEMLSVIRAGLLQRHAAAFGQAVLFRRVRALLIRPHGDGLIATTLNYDYEVRSAREAFADVPDVDIKGEMLDLAAHIISTKRGAFDPARYQDRYETALVDLVKAKLEGRTISPPKRQPQPKTIDLMQALRESAGVPPESKRRPRRARSEPPQKRAARASRRKAS